jgi:hypothetical protein
MIRSLVTSRGSLRSRLSSHPGDPATDAVDKEIL